MPWIADIPSIETLLSRWPGVMQVFFVVLAALILNAVLHSVFTLLCRRMVTARHVWREAMLSSISAPLQGVVWVAALHIAVKILIRHEAVDQKSLLAQLGPPALSVTAVLLVMWFCLRVVGRVQENMLARAKAQDRELDPTATDAIGKLVRAAIIITAALVIMQTLGFSISGLLAFGGIGGIAIGFAAQGLVANLFGGLTIYASRPFKVGEWITMPTENLSGTVESIGWRATRLLGFDRKPFYVPNSLFNTAVVINGTRMTNRRIMEHLHVRYRDIEKVRDIIADGNRMIGDHPGIDPDFFVFRFDTCGDHSLKLLVYAFTRSTAYTDYMEVKEDVLLKIAGIVQAHDAELAVPISNVYAPDGIRVRSEAHASDAQTAGLVEGSERSGSR